MNTAADTAQILDFNAFRQRRERSSPPEASAPAPVYVWYPVWVLVPSPAPPSHS